MRSADGLPEKRLVTKETKRYLAVLWTARGRDELGFREVAHYFVMSQYQAARHVGAVVSF